MCIEINNINIQMHKHVHNISLCMCIFKNIHMRFILIFKFMYLNVWGWSVRPKPVTCIDETNKTLFCLLAVGQYANCNTMRYNGINSTEFEDWSLRKRESYVVWRVVPDVSDDRIAFIFKVKSDIQLRARRLHVVKWRTLEFVRRNLHQW